MFPFTPNFEKKITSNTYFIHKICQNSIRKINCYFYFETPASNNNSLAIQKLIP